MRRFCLLLPVLLCLAPMVLTSCANTEKPDAGTASSGPHEIARDYHQGPGIVRLNVDKDTLSIAESLAFTIEAEVENGWEAKFPKFGDKLDAFGIRDFREDPPRLTAAGKVITRQVYTLDPFLSGDYTISPVQVRFHRKGATAPAEAASPDGDSSEPVITTDAISIKVTSLLEKDQKNLALNPIKGPVTMPAEPLSPWRILMVLGAVGLTAGGTVLLIRRSRRGKRPGAVPALEAHELAYRQLQEILDEKLLERGEIKEFFARVSDVLRLYIENRFGLHAPKRTTEEFLADLHREAPFSAEQQTLLSDFLRHCDLVKFAKYQPAETEIVKTVDACKAFIEATKVRPSGEPDAEK